MKLVFLIVMGLLNMVNFYNYALSTPPNIKLAAFYCVFSAVFMSLASLERRRILEEYEARIDGDEN